MDVVNVDVVDAMEVVEDDGPVHGTIFLVNRLTRFRKDRFVGGLLLLLLILLLSFSWTLEGFS